MAGPGWLNTVTRGVRFGGAWLHFYRDPIAFHRRRGVTIGEGVELFGGTIHTFGSEPYLVTIGNDVTISHDVAFFTHDGGLRTLWDRFDDKPDYYARIDVGNRVFLGARAILMPGVTIGDGSVVGAGAIVTRDLEAGVVVAGAPARPIKRLEEYAEGHRDEWRYTTGLSARQKRRLLLAALPQDAADHGAASPPRSEADRMAP